MLVRSLASALWEACERTVRSLWSLSQASHKASPKPLTRHSQGSHNPLASQGSPKPLTRLFQDFHKPHKALEASSLSQGSHKPLARLSSQPTRISQCSHKGILFNQEKHDEYDFKRISLVWTQFCSIGFQLDVSYWEAWEPRERLANSKNKDFNRSSFFEKDFNRVCSLCELCESFVRGLGEACDWEPCGVCGSLSGESGSLCRASGSVWEQPLTSLSQVSHKSLPRLSSLSQASQKLSQASNMPLTSIASHKALTKKSCSNKRNMMNMILKGFLLFERNFVQ